MKRVLVIDEALPFPADSGKRIRTTELLRRLTSDFAVTLAYHEEGDTPPEAIEAARDAGLALLPVPRSKLEKRGIRFAWDLLRNVFLSVPYMVMGHRTRALQDAVAAHVRETGTDLIHVEWTPLVANVPPDLGVPVCISAHNVEADIWRRYKENERSLPRKAYIALQHRKVRRFEQQALRSAQAVTAVSEHDGERIRSWTGQAHTTVVPNGVNAGYFARQPDAVVDRHEILFVGSLDWRPNLDAATWYLDALHEPLRERCPQAHLTIVGRNPPAWLLERGAATEGVEVHGSVPDVRPYMARSAICAVPLRIGGGSRLKICEALSMARPVVSTSVGAEGLVLGDGITIADGAEAFVDALAATLDDPAAAAQQAERGRARVMERYEWDRIAPLQAAAWHDAIDRGAGA